MGVPVHQRLEKLVGVHKAMPEEATSEGLQVEFDWQAGLIRVGPGFYELPKTHSFLQAAGHRQNRFEVPVEVELPIPDRDDPTLTKPFLCLAHDYRAKKSGIWLIEEGEWRPPIINVEFLAWRRSPTARWRVVHYYHMEAEHKGLLTPERESPAGLEGAPPARGIISRHMGLKDA